MTKICFLLLCHKSPDDIIDQVEYLLKTDSYVAVHIDKGAPEEVHKPVRAHFAENPNVVFVDPIKAGWGDWSLSRAALRLLQNAIEKFPDATHFYHLSGDCVPINTHLEMKKALAKNNLDFIETADFFTGNWIKTGPKRERIEFYHFFNERAQKRRFYLSYDIQRLLGVKRQPPEGIKMAIGSQWWCLRKRTVERILFFLDSRPDVIKFFKRCWIPDEIFFQSMVASLVRKQQISNSPPTFLRFSDYGMPTTFYDDHYHFLLSQDAFFARKISGNAKKLKARLIANFLSDDLPADASRERTGRKTIDFFVYAGREGVRYGSRLWEREDSLKQDDRLYIVVSKKWHVGKNYGQAISEATGIPFFGYVFDEESEFRTNLGGFERGLQKRHLAPSVFLKVLYETNKCNQAIIGIDPSRFSILETLSKSIGNVHVVELENKFSPEYLQGHAERAGLMSSRGKSVQSDALYRTILLTFRHDSDRLRTLNFRKFEHIRIWHSAKNRSEILANIFEHNADDFLQMARKIDIKD